MSSSSPSTGSCSPALVFFTSLVSSSVERLTPIAEVINQSIDFLSINFQYIF